MCFRPLLCLLVCKISKDRVVVVDQDMDQDVNMGSSTREGGGAE